MGKILTSPQTSQTTRTTTQNRTLRRTMTRIVLIRANKIRSGLSDRDTHLKIRLASRFAPLGAALALRSVRRTTRRMRARLSSMTRMRRIHRSSRKTICPSTSLRWVSSELPRGPLRRRQRASRLSLSGTIDSCRKISKKIMSTTTNS